MSKKDCLDIVEILLNLMSPSCKFPKFEGIENIPK